MGLTLDILLRRQGAPTVGADLDGSGATARMEASLKRQAEYQKVVARGARDYGVAATAAFTRVEGLIDQLNGNLKETTRLMREAETVNRDVARQTQRTADSSAQGWARMERQLKRNNELTALSVRALRGIGTAGAAATQQVLTGLDRVEAAQKRTAAAARLTARAVASVGEAGQSEAIQANLSLRRLTGGGGVSPQALAGQANRVVINASSVVVNGSRVGATPVQLNGGVAGASTFLRGGATALSRNFASGTSFARSREFVGDIVNAGTRFGGEAQGAFRDAFSGPLLGGGVVRGAGGLAAAGIRGATGAAASVAGLLGPVGGALGGALGVGGALGGAVVGAAGELAGAFVDKFVGVAKVGLVAGLGIAVAAGVSVTKSALAIDELEPQFAKFARTTGDDVPSALAKLQGSVDGTISKLDLMGLANQASLLGFEGGVNTLTGYYDLVKDVGDAAGTDAVKAIEAFQQAVGTGTERGLKTALRVTVDFKQATADAAKQLKRDADTFTEQELLYIRLAATVYALEQRMKETGRAAEGLDDKADRLKATLSDTSYEAGKNLKQSLAAAADALQPLAAGFADFVGDATASRADVLTGKIRGVKDALKDAGDFLSKLTLDDIARLAGNAWEEMWLRATAGGRGFYDSIELRAKQFGETLRALAIENAVVLGFATGGPVGALAGAAFKSQQHYAAGGDTIDGGRNAGVDAANARAAAFSAQAQNVSFSADPAALERLRAERAATLAAINGRPSELGGAAATSRPTPVVVVNPGLGGSASRPAASPSFGLAAAGAVLPGGAAFATGGVTGPDYVAALPKNSSYEAAAGRSTLTATLSGSLSPEVVAQLSGFIAAAASEGARFNAAVKALADAQQNAADSAAEAEILAPLVRRANDAKSELARLEEREARARKRAVEDVSAAWVDLWTYERDAAAEIRQNFDTGFAALRDGLSQSLDGINGAVQSRAQGLLGQVGGLEPSEDDGIPTKFKSAARKVRKRAARERRRSLQQLAGGRGSDDLAADGGALLTELFEKQGAIEIGAADARQAAIQTAFDGLSRLFEERTVAELELKDAVEAQTEAIVSHAETTAETLDAVVELAKTQAEALRANEARLEELTRVVNALRRGTK